MLSYKDRRPVSLFKGSIRGKQSSKSFWKISRITRTYSIQHQNVLENFRTYSILTFLRTTLPQERTWKNHKSQLNMHYIDHTWSTNLIRIVPWIIATMPPCLNLKKSYLMYSNIESTTSTTLFRYDCQPMCFSPKCSSDYCDAMFVRWWSDLSGGRGPSYDENAWKQHFWR